MKPLTVHLVLDRSGSMLTNQDLTIQSTNEYVASLAKDAPGSRFSLTLFDSDAKAKARIDTVISDVDIGSVMPLDRATYAPGGGTPLYDAIGHVIGLMDKETGDKALVILTDGEENTSSEFTKDKIKKLLDERQDKENWLVLYLGANQDAFVEGAKFGSRGGHTMSYSTAKLGSAMLSASASTARFAETRSVSDAAYTDEEREASK